MSYKYVLCEVCNNRHTRQNYDYWKMITKPTYAGKHKCNAMCRACAGYGSGYAPPSGGSEERAWVFYSCRECDSKLGVHTSEMFFGKTDYRAGICLNCCSKRKLHLKEKEVQRLRDQRKQEEMQKARRREQEEMRQVREELKNMRIAHEEIRRQKQALQREQEEMRRQEEARQRELEEIRNREATRQKELDEMRKKELARLKAEKELREYPVPIFMTPFKTGYINVCIVGNTGVGKTTFINTLRGLKPNDKRCGFVGHGKEGTMKATRYQIDRFAPIYNFWDLPGVGTANHPAKTYFKDNGIKWYDYGLVFGVDRFREMDLAISHEMRQHGVPFIYIRNKVDSAIDVLVNDEGTSEAFALELLRANVKEKSGLEANSNVYLVSARWSKRNKYDMPKLMQHLKTIIPRETSLKILAAEVEEKKDGRNPRISQMIKDNSKGY